MLIMYIIHLRGSQGGLDHTGWVADKGEHRPVCRLSGNCSHDADADADEGEGEGKWLQSKDINQANQDNEAVNLARVDIKQGCSLGCSHCCGNCLDHLGWQ